MQYTIFRDSQWSPVVIATYQNIFISIFQQPLNGDRAYLRNPSSGIKRVTGHFYSIATLRFCPKKASSAQWNSCFLGNWNFSKPRNGHQFAGGFNEQNNHLCAVYLKELWLAFDQEGKLQNRSPLLLSIRRRSWKGGHWQRIWSGQTCRVGNLPNYVANKNYSK